MKRARIVLCALALALSMGLAAPIQPVWASAADDKALDKVEGNLNLLWTFVDTNQGASDEQFYPAFVGMADASLKELKTAEKQLAATKETRGTKQAVDNLREDVQQLQVGLIAWRESAAAGDGDGFLQSSAFVSSVLDIYNDDVDAYNQSAYGTKAIRTLMLYSLPAFLSMALCGMLFAWAVLKNHHSQDVVQEILRKLRWHLALSMLPLIAAGGFLAYAFFFSWIPLIWGWTALAIASPFLIYTSIRYIRVRLVARRLPQNPASAE